MDPVIVVELPAEERASPNVATLLSACTVALRRGGCVLEEKNGEGRASNATAVVTFSSAERPRVLVEVTARGDGGPSSTSRRIVFRAEDSESERWRSIGFTIASLAGALGVGEGEQPPPEPAPAPATPAETPNPVRAPEPHRPRRQTSAVPLPPVHAGARFEIGPGLDRGPPRLGGALFLGYDLPGRVLSASALAADAVRPLAAGDVDMTWMRVGIGLSASSPLPLESEGRVGLLVVAERIAADETEAVTLREESRSRWLSGMELDLGLRWPRSARVSGLIGGSLVRLSGGTAVVSHGVELASSPATEGGFFAGLEARW